MSWKGFKLMLLLVAVLAVSAQAENLLTNGDFDTGSFPPWWSWAVAPNSTAAVLAGSNGNNYDGTPFAELWQSDLAGSGDDCLIGYDDIPFNAGDKVEISLMFKAVGYVSWSEEVPQWGRGGVGVDFYGEDEFGDPVWLEWGFENFPGEGNVDWTAFTTTVSDSWEGAGSWTAPEGTVSLNLKIKNWGGNGADTTTYIDDVVVIPEPATIAMLGLGGLALIRRKRA